MAWQWTAPAVDEIAVPLKPSTSGTGLAMNDGYGSGILQHTPGCSLSFRPCKRVFAWLCVRSKQGYWVLGRRQGGQNKQEESVRTQLHLCLSEQHRLLNKPVLGRTILLTRFPSQLYFEENCTEQFWQYQKPLDFLAFNARKEKEGILHQVILHLTKISE